MGVGAAALISVIALSNVSGESGLTYFDHFNAESLNGIQRSYIWIRAIKFLWPFIIVIDAVRAILMIVQLQRGYVALFICFSMSRPAMQDLPFHIP